MGMDCTRPATLKGEERAKERGLIKHHYDACCSDAMSGLRDAAAVRRKHVLKFVSSEKLRVRKEQADALEGLFAGLGYVAMSQQSARVERKNTISAGKHLLS